MPLGSLSEKQGNHVFEFFFFFFFFEISLLPSASPKCITTKAAATRLVHPVQAGAGRSLTVLRVVSVPSCKRVFHVLFFDGFGEGAGRANAGFLRRKERRKE